MHVIYYDDQGLPPGRHAHDLDYILAYPGHGEDIALLRYQVSTQASHQVLKHW
jgi:hypothetical protein